MGTGHPSIQSNVGANALIFNRFVNSVVSDRSIIPLHILIQGVDATTLYRKIDDQIFEVSIKSACGNR